MNDFTGYIILGLFVALIFFFLSYALVVSVLRSELRKSIPAKLQKLRDELEGKLNIKLEIEEDGKAEVVEVEEDKH